MTGLFESSKPLDVEVVLREADGIVAKLVREHGLLADLGEHAVVKLAPRPGHAGLDLRAITDDRQVEQGRLHAETLHRDAALHCGNHAIGVRVGPRARQIAPPIPPAPPVTNPTLESLMLLPSRPDTLYTGVRLTRHAPCAGNTLEG